MARTTTATGKAPKEPGRIAQMWTVLKMTVREDPASLWILLAAGIAPILLAVLLGLLLLPGNVIGLVLVIIAGVLLGLLLFLIVLGRRAERAAYSRIAGQAGAASAVIQNSLRGGWTGDSMPVGINPKTQDAVYRVIGKGGVALIAEGPASRTQRLVDEQRRILQRVLPNVPIHVIKVGPDADAVPLHRIPATLRRYKRVLRRAEVRTANSRLSSLERDRSLPIPKGMDPLRARAPRPR
ncbi:MAG: hypothetical protein BGO95_01005 [Micrococcales bacterium 73-13]|nr:MAG: hypothetical protein BGO95_01005 [Micrococcales bacterium 73-13]